MKSRWNSNKILAIHNVEGILVHSQENIENVVVDYYKNLFSSTNDSPYDGIGDFHSLSPRQVSQDQAQFRFIPITDDEIYSPKIHEKE